MGEGGTMGASDIVQAKRSKEDPRATGGLLVSLFHLRVNKTKQHSHVYDQESKKKRQSVKSEGEEGIREASDVVKATSAGDDLRATICLIWIVGALVHWAIRPSDNSCCDQA